MSSMESDAKLVLKAVDLRKIGTESFNPMDYNDDLEGLLTTLNLSGENYESIVFTTNGDKLLVTITGKGKWAGLTACGSYQNMKVSDDGCELDLVPPVISLNGDNPMQLYLGDTYNEPGAIVTDQPDDIDLTEDMVITGTVDINTIGEYIKTYTVSDDSGNTTTVTRTINVITEFVESKGVNRPRLAQGMIPIKWVTDHWVTTNEDDPDWYQYGTTLETRNWANAITRDCTIVDGVPTNIETCSMWVWIPRYAYQIATNFHTSTVGTINIKFLRDTNNRAGDNSITSDTPTYAVEPPVAGTAQTNFVIHPAFKFGDYNLTGMWVAKFEMSNVSGTLSSTPGQTPLTNKTQGEMFALARNMETNNGYGWSVATELDGTTGIFSDDNNNVDTHMMKNREWGAVAYLAQSIYGKNADLTKNGSNPPTTGGGFGTTYTTDTGQSTTGNESGIYDMSGGVSDSVMGNNNYNAGNSGLNPVSMP